MGKSTKITEHSPEKPVHVAKDQYVVGIGASAGGLEAIHEFFDNVPPETDLSFVIVQHLSPDYKSLMAELLSKHTQMKVSEAEDGMLLKPNCVYVIPNKKWMTIRNNRLRLTEKTNAPIPNTAIDVFLLSLAEDKKDRAIAVILSGTGTDGTRGIEAIKQHGGTVLVQDPVTARFDGMPNSAIASGQTDLILPPELMPEEIVRHVKQPAAVGQFEDNHDGYDEQTLSEILNLVRNSTAHDFTAYKRHTINRRIARRMQQLNFAQVQAYADFLRENPFEVELLGKDFLIGVTKFFRDPEAFDVIRRKVIPEICANRKAGEPVKVWVAGCSTGEEAYSLAILFYEHLQQTGEEIPVKIFATDLDKEAIEVAARGLYKPQSLRELSPERQERYFVRRDDKFAVGTEIRKLVIFSQHDLLKDPPYSRLDLVSCRNLLIYMNGALQKKVFSTFHYALNIGGFLFLGPSENPGDLSASLSEVDRRWKIYRNNLPAKHFVFDYHPAIYKEPVREKKKPAQPGASQNGSFIHRMHDVFSEVAMEEFGYAGVYVNENFEVIQAIGKYKKFLQLPDNRLQFNILKMVPDELSLALGLALRKAAKSNSRIATRSVRFREKRKMRSVHFVVKPYLSSKETLQRFLFVLFSEDQPQKAPAAETSAAPVNLQAGLAQFQEMEQELKETKENLHAAIEELETSNEELQSSNEELISSNEELQSTNEELQSLNEELHTVNSEHQHKIRELSELNDDLNNYFKSTEIGQIFLDKNLVIRKYTPAVVKQINIIESDIGRPISHFSYNIRYENLVDDLRQVLRTGQSIEKEIEVGSGRFYLMRIMPYVRVDKKNDGAVVTFVDITPLKHLNNVLSGVLESSPNGIMAFESVRSKAGKITDFRWTLANRASEQLVGREPGSLMNKSLLEEMPGNRVEGLFDKYVRVAETGKPLRVEHHYEHEGMKNWFETIAVRIENGIAVTFADITEKKRADERIITSYENLKRVEESLKRLNNELEQRVEARTRELSVSEERFRTVSLATNDALWDWNLVNNTLWWNEGFTTLFGYEAHTLEAGIESLFNRLHPDDRQRVTQGMNRVINYGETKWEDEFRFVKSDQSYASILGRGYVLQNENGIPYRMLGSLIDLTNLKKAQEELQRTNENLLRINTDLDNFVYTASHDLKAPIINLEGLIKYLERELKTAPEEVQDILNLIRVTIDKFKNTIRDLTEISKIQKGFQEEEDVIDLTKLLDDVQVSIRDMIVSAQAEVTADFSACRQLRYARKNLHSVLYNLLSNAIKYRSPHRTPQVHLWTEQLPDYVMIGIRDNGLGMHEDALKDLFTMFKRFHDHVEGTGVGLYIIKRIVENTDGKIEVESRLGEGTTFRVYLRTECEE